MVFATSIRLLCVAFILRQSLAFYIPGVAPLDFTKGENVEVKVCLIIHIDFYFPHLMNICINLKIFVSKAVKMTSTKTQLPYDYYDVAAHCKPLNGTKYKSENLGIWIIQWVCRNCIKTCSSLFSGEILRGDRIVNTKFKVKRIASYRENISSFLMHTGCYGRKCSVSHTLW